MTQQYLQDRIKDNQKFLLRLLNLNLFGYNPLRQWLGIDYKGKIDVVSHLSYGYISDIKKDKVYITRVYQQPDLGYKLNLILDSVPEIIIPKVGQPSWSLIQLRLARCATQIYQPSTEDGYIGNDNTGYFSSVSMDVGPDHYYNSSLLYRAIIKWDISDIPLGRTFLDATISLCDAGYSAYAAGYYLYINRLLQTNWTISANWNTYDGSHNWTSPGGDYTTTNKVSVACTAKGSPPTEPPSSSYWMNATNAQNLIQDCFDNQNRQVNLLIQFNNENISGSPGAYQWIVTKENTNVPSGRPKLTVTYTDNITTYSTLALTSNFCPYNEQSNSSTLALTSNFDVSKWKTETKHTSNWVKEDLHDLYKS
ncbi:MAG: DNRLRE domain-containing protein [Candidatus Anstonellales archaeon]